MCSTTHLFFIAFLRIELLLSPLLFVLTFTLTLRHYMHVLYPVARQMTEQFGKLSGSLTETIVGITMVKAAARENQEKSNFEKKARAYRDAFVQEGQIQARYVPPLLVSIVTAGAFLHGFLLFSRDLLSVGHFVTYMGLVGTLCKPAIGFVPAFSRIQLGVAAIKRILTPIQVETELDENKSGYQEKIKGSIVFENVTFGYDSTPILNNISFCVEPGQTIAIVGQTGSGKTTLTKLVNRIYDANQGRVLIDGVDICEWNLASLRSQIATIEQDVILFSCSVAENISFGLGQQAERTAIEQAAQEAQAHQFISQFPHNYDTQIGERGVTLSGGERQRLALARALLTNPRVIILDDMTSAIDSATEYEIQKAMRRLLKNRTTLLITHRLSLIRTADKILVLRQGELIDQGAHNELFARCKMYRCIFSGAPNHHEEGNL